MHDAAEALSGQAYWPDGVSKSLAKLLKDDKKILGVLQLELLANS